MATTNLLAPALDPLVVAAYAVAQSIEASFRGAHRETGGQWPIGCCNEASIALRDELREKLPVLGAEYVWGAFVMPTGMGGARYGHAWTVLADATILDVTAGQFVPSGDWIGGSSLALVFPSDPVAACWVESERPRV